MRRAFPLAETLAALLSALYLSLFFRRGLTPLDDGWFLDLGARVARGEVPYKDFYVLAPPGSFYAFSALNLCFGPTLLPSRILWLIAGVVMAAVLARIGRTTLPPFLSGIAGASAVIGTFPSILTVPYYWMSNVFGVCALAILLASADGSPARRLRLAGVLLIIALFFKHNTAAYVGAGLTLATLVLPTPDSASAPRRFWHLFSGALVAIAGLLLCLYLVGIPIVALCKSLVAMFFLPHGDIDIPMPLPWACFPHALSGVEVWSSLRRSTFWLPFIVPVLVIAKHGRWTRSASGRIPTLCAIGLYGLCMALHATPRAGWSYLSRALPVPILLLFLLAWDTSKGRSRWIGRIWAIVISAVLGMLVSEQLRYHLDQVVYLDGPCEGILSTEAVRDRLARIRTVVAPLLTSQGELLVLPDDNILYPYLGQRSRARFQLLLDGDLFVSTITEDLIRTRPKVVILAPADGQFRRYPLYAHPLLEIIWRTYRLKAEVDGTQIWVRKE